MQTLGRDAHSKRAPAPVGIPIVALPWLRTETTNQGCKDVQPPLAHHTPFVSQTVNCMGWNPEVWMRRYSPFFFVWRRKTCRNIAASCFSWLSTHNDDVHIVCRTWVRKQVWKVAPSHPVSAHFHFFDGLVLRIAFCCHSFFHFGCYSWLVKVWLLRETRAGWKKKWYSVSISSLSACWWDDELMKDQSGWWQTGVAEGARKSG